MALAMPVMCVVAMPTGAHADAYTGAAIIVIVTAVVATVARVIGVTAIVIRPRNPDANTDAARPRKKADLRHSRHCGQYTGGCDNAERDLFHEYSPLICCIENARGRLLFRHLEAGLVPR
jgi:hypothetical protein